MAISLEVVEKYGELSRSFGLQSFDVLAWNTGMLGGSSDGTGEEVPSP
jgi:hypothetical protein